MIIGESQHVTSPYQKIENQEFITSLLKEMVSLINHESNPYTQETRNQMYHIISELERNGYHIREGTDDFRAQFVGLQGVIEHLLGTQKIAKKIPCLLGAIHTPTPATPLCAKLDGTNVKNLVDSEVIKNPDKISTVTERAVTIRRLLETGTTLFAVYPESGLEKRKVEEQQIFLSVLRDYPEHLKAIQIKNKEIDPALVGAIYFFTDETGKTFVFSIKAQQANKLLEKSTWGIWFGTIDHPEVKKRVEEISDYLIANGGPDLREEFSKICKF